MNDEGGGASRSTDPASGSSAATDVSLREYLTMRLGYERQISDLQFDSRDMAIRLQAAEYERRFQILNHAHEQAVAERSRTVSSEIWDQFQKQYAADIKSIQRFQNRTIGALGLVTVVLPTLTAIVVYLLTRTAVPVE